MDIQVGVSGVKLHIIIIAIDGNFWKLSVESQLSAFPLATRPHFFLPNIFEVAMDISMTMSMSLFCDDIFISRQSMRATQRAWVDEKIIIFEHKRNFFENKLYFVCQWKIEGIWLKVTFKWIELNFIWVYFQVLLSLESRCTKTEVLFLLWFISHFISLHFGLCA
jgi:hypothetical protein